MSKLKTALSLIKTPKKLISPLGFNGFFDWMTDEKYIRFLYWAKQNEKLNLNNPQNFNEKLQWLKLYDRNPQYVPLVDKIKAKEEVGNLIGKKYIVPLYEVWKSSDDIKFDNLPSKFVLKCNHDQGSVIIVDDVTKVDLSAVRMWFKDKLKHSPYPGTREFAYKYIEPMVFAEKYLEANIIDYKFYCFNGEPKFLYCGQGLTFDHSLKIDFFDLEWNTMPFYRTDYNRLGHIPKPSKLEEMIEISKVLSRDVPFVRIDLFEVSNQVYFSEFTLCPASGFMPFYPPKYNEIIGSWINLPKIKIK